MVRCEVGGRIALTVEQREWSIFLGCGKERGQGKLQSWYSIRALKQNTLQNKWSSSCLFKFQVIQIWYFKDTTCMYIKHPNFPGMESDPRDPEQNSGVPSLFASEVLGLPLGGATSSGSQRRLGPQTGPRRPHLTSYIALTWVPGKGCCTWPPSTPRVRNYSETPSCSQAPHWASKQNLWKQISSGSFGLIWQLPVPRVHQQALETQTFSMRDAKETWMGTVFETRSGKSCGGTRGFDVFLLAPSRPNGAEFLFLNFLIN